MKWPGSVTKVPVSDGEEETAPNAEANHRIGNSLAVLSAMLRVESRQVDSLAAARDALNRAADRVTAFSRIHFALADIHDDGTIDLGAYLKAIGRDLSDSFDVAVEIHCDAIVVGTTVATGIAVIVSELAMNAMKHGAVGTDLVVVVDVVAAKDDALGLLVRDNGVGLPKDFDAHRSDGLGMRIVTSTVERLGGTLRVMPGRGATFRMAFPSSGHRPNR